METHGPRWAVALTSVTANKQNCDAWSCKQGGYAVEHSCIFIYLYTSFTFLIVYFLLFVRQQTGAEGRSSSMESEDETEIPPLLRTISMETDDASAEGSIPFFAGSSSSLEFATVTTPAPCRKIHMQVGNSVMLVCKTLKFMYIDYLFM